MTRSECTRVDYIEQNFYLVRSTTCCNCTHWVHFLTFLREDLRITKPILHNYTKKRTKNLKTLLFQKMNRAIHYIINLAENIEFLKLLHLWQDQINFKVSAEQNRRQKISLIHFISRRTYSVTFMTELAKKSGDVPYRKSEVFPENDFPDTSIIIFSSSINWSF